MSEFGYIDGILSTQFDECSIAAADAARIANEALKNADLLQVTVQPIGRYTIAGYEEWSILPLVDTEVESDLFSENKVQLALARHPIIDDLPLSLVAIINQDSMLPIATFEQRADGQCSYVQIGQEIDEDKLVVTEGTTRTDQIEAVRELLKGGKPGIHIHQLIQDEAELYKAEIETALLPSVCKNAEAYYQQEQKHSQVIHLLDSEGNLEHDSGIHFSYVDITLVTTHKNNTLVGHDVTLMLGREIRNQRHTVVKKHLFRKDTTTELIEEQPEGPLQLIAFTRGNVGIRLARLETGSNAVSLYDYDMTAGAVDLGTLLPVISNSDTVRRDLVSSKDDFATIHEKFYLEEDFSESFASHFRSYGAKGKERIRVYTSVIDLLNQFAVEDRFAVLLDEGTSTHELVLYKSLGKLGSEDVVQYEGVLKDRKAGKTTTDVATKVTLAKGDQKVRIHVEGRPIALEGFLPATLFDEVLRLDAKNSKLIDQDKIDEIAEVIGTICVDQSEE